MLAGEVEIRDGGGGLGQPLDGLGQAPPHQQSENHGDGEDAERGIARVAQAVQLIGHLRLGEIDADEPGLLAEIRLQIHQHHIGLATDGGPAHPALAFGPGLESLLEVDTLFQNGIRKLHPAGQEVLHRRREDAMGEKGMGNHAVIGGEDEHGAVGIAGLDEPRELADRHRGEDEAVE